MIRTQIQLSEEQAAMLKHIARQRGISVAELIREGARMVVANHTVDEQWARASALVGRYHDTSTNVAHDHDQYLDEAYSS